MKLYFIPTLPTDTSDPIAKNAKITLINLIKAGHKGLKLLAIHAPPMRERI